MKKIYTSLLLIGFLSACSSQTTKPDSKADTGTAGGNTSPAPAATTGAAGGVNTTLNPLQDPNNVLSKRSIYFDYDSYSVKDEYKSLVLAHAAYLRSNANARVLLQGNTDERGSREYNLALGQRRADSVKSILTLSGVKEAQVESVSLGEEKPRATGHDESAYAENRRTDIRYQGE